MSNMVTEGGGGLFAASSIAVSAAGTADADALVAAQAGLRLMGFSIKESAGAPAAATAAIVIGATGAGGTAAAYCNLAASGSQTQWFGDAGIDAASGISIDRITGNTTATVFYKVVT